MANAWAITSANQVGAQPIDETSTTARHTLGTIVTAKSATYGAGEFIYLTGVANTAVGSVVSYNASTYQTELCATTKRLPRPIAVAMSANGASAYGWYQISGIAVMKKATATCLVAKGAVGVKTTGLINTTATGVEVIGAFVSETVSVTATTRTTVPIVINRPAMQGRIT